MTFEETFKNCTLEQKVEWALGPYICNLSENMRSIIVDLKAENKRLKAELKQTEAQDQVVIDGLRKENRKTLHALWMARALRAKIEAKRFFWFLSVDVSQGNREAEIWHESLYKKWCWVERKCLAKAEEYK